MAGTTTNFAIQYPSSTDYVTDGATAMKTISDDVDAILFAEVANQNLIINGAMQVTQRSAVGTAVAGITTSSYYAADRFRVDIGSFGTWSQTTIADAPTGSGFRNSAKLQCTTPNVSPTAAGDAMQFQQVIEGQNLQAIRKGTASAQKLTLSFWVKAFQTGTFIAEVRDLDNSRSVSKSYTVNASNTWEYKTLLFPADTTGALDNDANGSIELNWWLGAGSTYTSGTLQTTWGTLTSANRAVGQTDTGTSASNNWFMTGASLTVGEADVPFQFKSFADDLRACQRYYLKASALALSFAFIKPTLGFAEYFMPTTMRAATSLTCTTITRVTRPGILDYAGDYRISNSTTAGEHHREHLFLDWYSGNNFPDPYTAYTSLPATITMELSCEL